MDGREDRRSYEEGEERYEGCGGSGVTIELVNTEGSNNIVVPSNYTPTEDEPTAMEEPSLRGIRVVPIISSSRIVDRH